MHLSPVPLPPLRVSFRAVGPRHRSSADPLVIGTTALGHVLVNVRTSALDETISFMIVEPCAAGEGAVHA